MRDPPKRKGPLGDPTGDQPPRRDPPPKGPGGQPKEIEDPKHPGQPDEIKVSRVLRSHHQTEDSDGDRAPQREGRRLENGR